MMKRVILCQVLGLITVVFLYFCWQAGKWLEFKAVEDRVIEEIRIQVKPECLRELEHE